jgi:diphosphomevalonate decarboxylase
MKTVTALAHPNIAFIKYWGNRNPVLRLPENGSISMNLASLSTQTTVRFDDSLKADSLLLNGVTARPAQLQRVSAFLDLLREVGGTRAVVESTNNFPSGAGIASSSSAFAALALAASRAIGFELDERGLSRLARSGSGSASRSVPPGFVEWFASDMDEGSFAQSIAPVDHWDLFDTIAVISEEHKTTGSTEGHALADTSPLQAARVGGADKRLDDCRAAIMARDFERFAAVVEADCHLMHAVMMTSKPALHYWLPGSLGVMDAVRSWRQQGWEVCYTLDAGPNVHVLSTAKEAASLAKQVAELPGVLRVLQSGVGGGATLVNS